jgi:hypothetical protein
MPPELLIVILVAAVAAGVLVHVLTRRTRRGAWVLWALLIALGATVFYLGTQAVGHMANFGHTVFLLVIWTPAVLGAGVGTVTGYRGRNRPGPDA